MATRVNRTVSSPYKKREIERKKKKKKIFEHTHERSSAIQSHRGLSRPRDASGKLLQSASTLIAPMFAENDENNKNKRIKKYVGKKKLLKK